MVTDEDVEEAVDFLGHARNEVLNEAVEVLVNDYGFSRKRVERAFNDVMSRLEKKDRVVIDSIEKEGTP